MEIKQFNKSKDHIAQTDAILGQTQSLQRLLGQT